ncbi:MAG TPA: hypothetical protein HPP77_02145 [Candidatus Hydrogenedentes bacterium]|nr:hypothetical protein [Candidatus Hydrogenedentota bacterium]
MDHLVPYTVASAAWSNHYSNVAILWEHEDKPGLQTLISLQGWAGAMLTHDLLTWSISETGERRPLTVKDRNYRPDWVAETDTAEGLELVATVAWPRRNALAVEFVLKNTTDSPRELVLDFDYPGKGIVPDWRGPYPVPSTDPDGGGIFEIMRNLHFVSIQGEPTGSWSTIYPVREHGRNILWVSSFVTGLTDGATKEICCLADLAPRSLTLAPGEQTRLMVPMAFGRWRREARDVYDSCVAQIKEGWGPAHETARISALVESAPPLPAKYRGQRRYERLYAHAITSLDSLFIRGDGGFTGGKRLTWTSKHGLAMAFFWDTSFSCVGAREFNAAASHESIECFTDHPTPRGSLPGTLCDTNRAGEGQSPIMSWSAWSVYQRTKDKQWLGRVYQSLAGNNEFWFTYHVSPRGLCQFFNAGQVADNDARFDPIQGEGHANQMLQGFEAPDLNAFLVMDMKCLGEMADALGREEEAARWRQKADELGQRIVDALYFPEEAMFYDVRVGTHEKLSGVKGPNMFLPLWAGVPLPQAEVARVIEGHMLNPDEFFRELPFPSLSYDNPKYDPIGYWRGRIWPHVVYWMTQTLWRHGYCAEAELTADRLLSLIQKSPWIHENYASREDLPPPGVAEYNWSLATTIELLLERYKDPLP